MKKILLLVLIMVSLGNLYAQDEGIIFGKFYFGAKAGYGTVDFSSTNVNVDNFAERTYRNLAYGVLAGYKINAKVSIQAEGVYAQYAANNIRYDHIYRPDNPLIASYSASSVVDHVDMDLYSADIPVTARYQLGTGTLAPYVYVGVNWGIYVTGYTTIVRKIEDPYGTIYREFNDGVTEQIKYNEIAPIFGGGLNMNLGDKFTVFGDARIKYGVQNISNVQNGLGFKNNALWLSAGLIFNL